jgi:hypothetical protein
MAAQAGWLAGSLVGMAEEEDERTSGRSIQLAWASMPFGTRAPPKGKASFSQPAFSKAPFTGAEPEPAASLEEAEAAAGAAAAADAEAGAAAAAAAGAALLEAASEEEGGTEDPSEDMVMGWLSESAASSGQCECKRTKGQSAAITDVFFFGFSKRSLEHAGLHTASSGRIGHWTTRWLMLVSVRFPFSPNWCVRSFVTAPAQRKQSRAEQSRAAAAADGQGEEAREQGERERESNDGQGEGKEGLKAYE